MLHLKIFVFASVAYFCQPINTIFTMEHPTEGRFSCGQRRTVAPNPPPNLTLLSGTCSKVCVMDLFTSGPRQPTPVLESTARRSQRVRPTGRNNLNTHERSLSLSLSHIRPTVVPNRCVTPRSPSEVSIVLTRRCEDKRSCLNKCQK